MLKKTTSLTLAFSGLVMLATSIVLYFGPASHVGHFCPWSFMTLSRHHWGALHLNSGVLFCLAMAVHACLNWSILVAYVKKRNPGFFSLAASLVLTLYVCVGGFYEMPPMGQILDLARAFRISSTEKYGSPPYGAAAAYPVAHIARYMGWDTEKSLRRLALNSIVVASPNQSLTDLARSNGTSLGRVLDIMATRSEGAFENEE